MSDIAFQITIPSIFCFRYELVTPKKDGYFSAAILYP
jgi:hypothetical protein